MATLVLSRRYRCALLLTFAALIPGNALAKGGTNMHEMASSRHGADPITNIGAYAGGRYSSSRCCRPISPATLRCWRPRGAIVWQ
jgi:hypothetical protein